MHIGNAIKDLRQQRGFKQNQFADLCDLSQSYLSLIEKGNKEPTFTILKRIANILEIPMPVLVFYSIDISDINENKREAFQMLEPSIKGLINNLFLEKA